MDTKWAIEHDKKGQISVKENTNGQFESKDEALNAAREMAKTDKTILKVYRNDNTEFETANYTQILSPTEWTSKLKSELKISKAEYMISKSREKDIKAAIRQAKVNRDYEKEAKLKIRLNETLLKKRKHEINYHEAKKRLSKAKKAQKS